MKALPLLWKYPDQYWKHIIFPDPFYTKINFIFMLTKKKARRSCYAEILIEAKLVTSGIPVSVFSGKTYSKALFNLEVVAETFERPLFEVFAEENEIEIRPEVLLNLTNACSSSSCHEELVSPFKTSQLPTLPTNTNNFKQTCQIDILEKRLHFGFPSWIKLNWSFCSLIL